MPDDLLAVEGEGDGEIVCGEMAVSRRIVINRERISLDRPQLRAPFGLGPDRELRHRQMPIEEYKGCVILELAVRRPLHANELRGQDGEARVADGYNGLGVGDWIVDWRIGAANLPPGCPIPALPEAWLPQNTSSRTLKSRPPNPLKTRALWPPFLLHREGYHRLPCSISRPGKESCIRGRYYGFTHAVGPNINGTAYFYLGRRSQWRALWRPAGWIDPATICGEGRNG